MTADINTKIKLARKFGSLIQEGFTTQQFRIMLDRNKAETDDAVCHTHDFCDANMYMAEAFQTVIGREPDVSDEADAELWSDAWSIAKAAEFFA